MKRILILTMLALTGLVGLQAQRPAHVPAPRTPITRVQPNGDTLTVLLRGDEHHHFMMTTDGYLLREDAKGYICYAYYAPKGNIVVGKRRAHNADKRSRCEQRYLEKTIPNLMEDKR
ncbi:MAG: hypothetical protein IJ609_04985 [Paludibacteraceae bacterium]|nr:hypothetical protein [Paludibacteraceae bacterium]